MNVVAMRPKPAPDSFDEFWLAYPHPRRVGRVLAKAKWDAITNGGLSTRTLDRDSGQYVSIELKASPAEILAGLKAYDERNRNPGAHWEYKDGGKFICHPATWLNQGRWMDFA